MKKIDVEITGITPLLHNRFPIEDNGINQSKRKKKVVNVDEIVQKALYKKTDGTLYAPAEHIWQSIINVSTDFKWEGKKTYKNLMQTGILIEPEQISLISDTYEVDARPVPAGASGGKTMSYRPRFNSWKLQFILSIIDDENISLSTMKEILDRAGATKGIGTYRPRFGRFMVTKFQEIEGA